MRWEYFQIIPVTIDFHIDKILLQATELAIKTDDLISVKNQQTSVYILSFRNTIA
jgi:hypothetical protein